MPLHTVSMFNKINHDERTNAGKLGSDEHLGENLHLTPITFRVFPW